MNKNKLGDLKSDIKYMPKNEVKNKTLNLLAGLLEKILDIHGLLNVSDLICYRKAKSTGIKNINPKTNDYQITYFIGSIKCWKQFTKT